jgi:hypothetical protein
MQSLSSRLARGALDAGTSAIASLRAALDRPLKAVLMTEDTSSAVKELRDPLVGFVSKPVNADHRSLVGCDPARQSATATPILHFIVH